MRAWPRWRACCAGKPSDRSSAGCGMRSPEWGGLHLRTQMESSDEPHPSPPRMWLAPPVAFLPLPATQEWGEGVLRFTKQILPHWGHWGRGARAWDHETFHEPYDGSLDFERLVHFRFIVPTHVQVWRCSLPMNLGAPASLPAWQSARNTPAGMPAVPTTRRFMAGEQVRTEHETFHEPTRERTTGR